MSRCIDSAKQIVPEAEDDAEVLAMLVVLHQIVVPDVQSRRIQKITEGSPVQIEIGVIQMADDRCEDGNPEDNPRINVQKEERKISKAVVNGDLHPVEAHISDPIEFPDAVVQLVKFP